MRTPLPRFKVVNPGVYELQEDYEVPYCSHIYNYNLNVYPLMSINNAGWIVIKKGFRWDGPSGPAINTVNTMAASMVHDCLYRMMRKNFIRPKHKAKADKLYRRMLKGAGVGWFRRWYQWAAVSAFGRVT